MLSVQGQVHVALSKLLTQYGDEIGSITTTGHSLGGALASLCAFDIAWSRINRVGDKPGGALIPVTAFTFEAPRVGAPLFRATQGTLNQLNSTPGLLPRRGCKAQGIYRLRRPPGNRVI